MTKYRTHLRMRLVESQIPEHLHEGLVEYFAARRPVGSFLTAVLENDLRGAASRADEVNRYCLAEIVMFLYNYCPSPAWGSPTAVAAWLSDPEPVPEVFE